MIMRRQIYLRILQTFKKTLTEFIIQPLLVKFLQLILAYRKKHEATVFRVDN